MLAQLVAEKQRAGASKGAYVLGAKQDLPGSFYLAFITNTKPYKEYMVVTPDGIYFRHEVGALIHFARNQMVLLHGASSCVVPMLQLRKLSVRGDL